MMKHVLIPLDGSLLAETALQAATQFSPADARITLLTIIPSLPLMTYGLADINAPVGEFEAHLDAYLTEANRYVRALARDPLLATRHIDPVVQIGDPAHCIVTYAEKTHVDLIVMTTHGRSGISRWVFGSVTYKVMSASPCPILVVPRRSLEKQAEGSMTEVFAG